jgi:ubiquinone/menaquinone biosynthesis C-methylase UbiE
MPGSKILDLGCGTGLISMPLHDLGYRVVACDVSAGMLSRAAENFGSRSIELRKGDGFDIPASAGEFDAVISRMYLPHFSEWPRILREKGRVTRGGGVILFDFGNREHLDGYDPQKDSEFPYATDVANPATFYAVASEKEMHIAAEQAGCTVEQIIPHGLLLNNLNFWRAAGRRGVEQFNAKLDQLLVDEKARQLLLVVEEEFISRLSKSTTYGNIVVLRRSPIKAHESH